MQAQRGFTMFELVVVLVMIGILTAGLVPLLTARHANSMDQGEREALQTAREALITYGIQRSGMPAPRNSASSGFNPTFRPNFPATWAATNESFLPWDDPNLGVANFGPYRKYFWFDVRSELRRDFGSAANPISGVQIAAGFQDLNSSPSPQNFCINVRLALATAGAADPQVCAAPPAVGQEDQACTPAGPFNNAALTLISFGSNGVPEMAHRTLNVLSTPGPVVRNHENPARPVNRNAGAGFYDDMVASVSLAELARECDRVVSQQVCPGNQRILTLLNGFAANTFYRIDGGACTTLGIGSGAQVSLGCRDPNTTTVLFDNTAGCTSPFTNTPAPGVTISTLGSDANNDGQISIILPANNTVRVF